ncbi:MAG: hypothetical protein AAGB31_15970 [Bdellovibrio sp.]
MKTITSFLIAILFSSPLFAQNSAEVMCRAQAKEAALQAYSGCITQARNQHVEEVRKNYQKELAALKSKYDRELKSMGVPTPSSTASSPKKSSAKVKATAKSNRTVKTSVTKGIPKELPNKAFPSSEALPMQTVTDSNAVVAVGPEESSSDLEKEAQEADQIEIIDIPTE